MPVVYEKYKSLLSINAEFYKFAFTEENVSYCVHSPRWLYKMLKVRLGKSLLSYTPRKKNSGRLLYRNGIDLLNSLHLHIVEQYHTVDIMQTETNMFF